MSSVAPCGTSAGKSAGCTADGGGGGLCSARGERKAGRGERLGGSSDGGAGAAGAVGLRVSCAWSDCVHALMTVLVSSGLTAAVHTSQLTSHDNVHLCTGGISVSGASLWALPSAVRAEEGSFPVRKCCRECNASWKGGALHVTRAPLCLASCPRHEPRHCAALRIHTKGVRRSVHWASIAAGWLRWLGPQSHSVTRARKGVYGTSTHASRFTARRERAAKSERGAHT